MYLYDMKILLSEKQFESILEWNFRKEFKEIDIIPSDDRIAPSRMSNIEDADIDTEFDINKHFDDRQRQFITHNVLKKTNKKLGKKIVWENKLDLDEYNDIAYIILNYPEKLHIDIYDDDYDIIMKIKLRKLLDGYQISYTSVAERASGKRLAIRSYLKFVEISKRPLYSDYTQTPESRFGIWYKLYELFPDKVKVFADGKIYDIKIIDNEMYYDDNKKVYDEENNLTPILKLIP
jgi:hypothetical protein